MKKILIFTSLKSQVNFNDTGFITQDEPTHPYSGILWSNIIKKHAALVEYINTTSFNKYKYFKYLYLFILLPRNYSTIIVYSTGGLGRATILKLFNCKSTVVFYSLSKINPDGNFFAVLVRKLLLSTDILFSNHIVYGLSNLSENKFLQYKIKKSTYFPFLTDYNFFQSIITNSLVLKFNHNEFILIVGDITRDDKFVYDELEFVKTPILRITRDSKVVKKVEKLINKNRGDVVLSGVSFQDLANYYNRAKCCIVASSFDHWQPGGITSIAEALACNGICICNSGGEIESEFKFLADQNKICDPLIYFNYPQKNSLRNVYLEFETLSKNEVELLRSKSNKFSNSSLNFNNMGLKILNNLIKDQFK